MQRKILEIKRTILFRLDERTTQNQQLKNINETEQMQDKITYYHLPCDQNL